MDERLEDRLRHHLSTIDTIRVGSEDTLTSAATRLADRRIRRRRVGVALSACVLIAAGAVVVASTRPTHDNLVTSDTGLVETSVAATTDDAAGPATSEPVLADDSTSDPEVIVWSLAAVDPRGPTVRPSVVWTGSEAIAVGGLDPDGQPRTSAAAYDPVADSWRMLADQGDAGHRIDPLVEWTGAEVLVIGGDQPDGSLLLSYTQVYDPASDTWRTGAAPQTNSFVSDRSPSAWTGTELLVWPPELGSEGVVPAAYDPATDTWRDLPAPPVEARQQAASVWTGTEWIVWGGTTGERELSDGAAYDPATDTWRVLAASPLSERRVRGVWTGTEMIVTAGSRGGDRQTGNGELALGDGAAYDPVADSWRPISPGPAHPGFEPIWTGQFVVMFAKGRASLYDPVADVWGDACCPDSVGAFGDSPVWTGEVALLLGQTEDGFGGAVLVPAATRPALPTCDDPGRPDLDVANEPLWRQFAEYRDWTRDGCLVRIDVLADRPGPDHCGMESARVIITGDPLGARYTTSGDDLEYLRDPNGVLGANEPFDPAATLPDAAVDTGYRSGTEELWIVPGDSSAIFLVDGDQIERWPLGESVLCS